MALNVRNAESSEPSSVHQGFLPITSGSFDAIETYIHSTIQNLTVIQCRQERLRLDQLSEPYSLNGRNAASDLERVHLLPRQHALLNLPRLDPVAQPSQCIAPFSDTAKLGLV